MLGTCYEVERKNGSIWKVQFRLLDTYIYKKFADEAEARQFHQSTSDRLEWEAAKSAGPRAILPKSGSLLDLTLAKAIDMFLDSDRCTEGARDTLPTVKTSVEASGVTIGRLTERWIRQYIDEMRASTTSRGTQFAYSTILKQCTNTKLSINWLADSLDVPRPPFPFSTRMFPKGWEVKRTRRLDPWEEAALTARFETLDGPKREFWPLLMGLAIETGARQSELVNLPWAELQSGGGKQWWTLPAHRTKGNTERPIPFTPRAAQLMDRARELRKPDDPRVFHAFSSAAVVSALFHRHVKALGIVDLKWHDLRHEGISRLVLRQRALKIEEIMLITGHSDPAMHRRYANLRADELAALLV